MEASVAQSGQGAPAPGTAAGAGGQGQAGAQPTAADQGGGGFNWGLFPDVPIQQRDLLEPHLKNIQGHVTQMEQRYAPYSDLLGAVEPQQVQGLMAFLNNYAQDPLATALGILNELQQDRVIPPNVSMDAVTAMLRGEEAGQMGAPPGQVQPEQGQEGPPPWAIEMMNRLEQLEGSDQQRGVAEQEAQQDQMLEQAKANIRNQLTQAGIGEDIVDDDLILSAIINQNGDELAAAQMLTGMRDRFLGSFTNGKTTGGQQPAVQGKLPTAPKGRIGRRGDPFTAANEGARQFLEQQAAMEAG